MTQYGCPALAPGLPPAGELAGAGLSEWFGGARWQPLGSRGGVERLELGVHTILERQGKRVCSGDGFERRGRATGTGLN
jgi:hypothetical protein